jgi:Fe(3+) dicitrate transport protein
VDLPLRSGRVLFFLFLLCTVASSSVDLLAQTSRSDGPVAPATAARLSGQVVDSTGAPLPAVTVELHRLDGVSRGPLVAVVHTDAAGRFTVDAATAMTGPWRLTTTLAGYGRTVTDLTAGALTEALRVVLEPAAISEAVTVRATRLAGLPEDLRRLPGSIDVLDEATLAAAHVFSINEALRKIPGLNVRDEEGFGLRPNIGIRGLNPTRSTKVLLLEDGVPLTFAPYGDNATYYHPPVERIESIEVLKGAGQIVHGPSTVGGVINYVTPTPPQRPAGIATIEGGSRNFFNGHGTVGTTMGRIGVLGSYMHRQGDGARDHTHSRLDDLNGKAVLTLSASQVLTVRGSHYVEDSQVTYSGLRTDEYAVAPRQNPFVNDRFDGRRTGTSATHALVLSQRAVLSTNLYASWFRRHWWRQSSNSAQRPNDAADPSCGGMANLLTSCGNEGRLRQYYTVGVEPRLRVSHGLFGLRQETEVGVRLHVEHQDRRQENGDTPTSRSGRIVEDNVRDADAYAAFVQHRMMAGQWTLTPGVRLEHVEFARLNRLGNAGAGASGATRLTQVVPGVGVAYGPGDRYTIFGGVHRGFAPPRVEDIITNTGGVVELDPEFSWNYELGVRSRLHPGVAVDATLFRMDYENQLVPASLAGGVGAVLTNGGQTLHQGVEAGVRLDTASLLGHTHNVTIRTAYTWLPTARFTGVRFSNVGGFGSVSVSGNRLPYAPERTLTASVAYAHHAGLDAQVEAQHVGAQFADDLNTIVATPDGQRGLLPSMTVWNAAVNYRLTRLPLVLFGTVKNVTDLTAVVDRTRGILPNAPRLVQVGVRISF